MSTLYVPVKRLNIHFDGRYTLHGVLSRSELTSCANGSLLQAVHVWAALEVSRSDEGEVRRVQKSAEMQEWGETGDPRENRRTSGIVRHESHMRKSGGRPRRESNSVRLGRRRVVLPLHHRGPFNVRKWNYFSSVVTNLIGRMPFNDFLLGLRCRVVSSLASHQGEPGSIPGRVTGFSHVGIVPDDVEGHSGAAPYSPQSPSSALKTSLLRAAQISSLTHSPPLFLQLPCSENIDWYLNADFMDVAYGRSGAGTPGMHGSNGQQRTKRMRTSFKHHQLRTMKSYFAINHNPDAKDLKQLSQKTGLPKRVLQVLPLQPQNSRHVPDTPAAMCDVLVKWRCVSVMAWVEMMENSRHVPDTPAAMCDVLVKWRCSVRPWTDKLASGFSCVSDKIPLCCHIGLAKVQCKLAGPPHD
ncbi:hypothetical protein PR048_010144 [Dryococelus australis]|uniref:Homeobox domain-containing protein n=1 Tax=Dryococelus australis TaxID=614101 RepID=A0ABQ9I2Z1_9NEOP|nr:hypothetical protein PR048_010144 [Dryococelus australis]